MITLNEIQNYVKGKRVLLVGNSDELIKTDNSKLIDSYDVVVRMNHATPQDNIGRKTDIWLCSFVTQEIQLKKISVFNARYNIRLNDDGNLHPALHNVFYIYPDKERDKIRKLLDSKYPSTGAMALYFFLNVCDCAVDIIGYDGFKTGTFYNTNKTMASKWHNVKREQEYISELLQKGSIKHASFNNSTNDQNTKRNTKTKTRYTESVFTETGIYSQV